MKTLQIFLLSLASIMLSFTAAAQTKTETIAVSGECGMCKKKIETAAKAAGAIYADWNVDSKKLTVKYSESANAAKIQQGVAAAGYDTPAAKAPDSAYNKLHDCCKYERTASTESCCADETCCTDGICTKEAACCNDKSCCTDGGCKKDAVKITPVKSS